MEILSPQTINDLRKMIEGNYDEDEIWVKDIHEKGEPTRRVVVNGDDDVLCRIRPDGSLDENPAARQKPKVKPSGNPKTTHENNPDFDIDTLSDHVTARKAHDAAVEKDKITKDLKTNPSADSTNVDSVKYPRRLFEKNRRI